MSLTRQCELAGVTHSSLYNPAEVWAQTRELVRSLDEKCTRTPAWGIHKMTIEAGKQGWVINHKRVARLLRLMSLMAVFPGPKTSVPAPGHKIYP